MLNYCIRIIKISSNLIIFWNVFCNLHFLNFIFKLTCFTTRFIVKICFTFTLLIYFCNLAMFNIFVNSTLLHCDVAMLHFPIKTLKYCVLYLCLSSVVCTIAGTFQGYAPPQATRGGPGRQAGPRGHQPRGPAASGVPGHCTVFRLASSQRRHTVSSSVVLSVFCFVLLCLCFFVSVLFYALLPLFCL